MNDPLDSTQWQQYVETPYRKSAPVKLEYIVAARIEAFMRAKKIKTTRSAGIKRTRN